MTEKQQYGDEIKAQVLAALLAGQSIGEVSKAYNIPEGTIKSWRARKGATQLQQDALSGATDATTKKEIGDLLLEYLQANLITLRDQMKVFGDPEWLKKQSASELAVLHGVMTDKAIRLLEAMSKANAQSDDSAT